MPAWIWSPFDVRLEVRGRYPVPYHHDIGTGNDAILVLKIYMLSGITADIPARAPVRNLERTSTIGNYEIKISKECVSFHISPILKQCGIGTRSRSWLLRRQPMINSKRTREINRPSALRKVFRIHNVIFPLHSSNRRFIGEYMSQHVPPTPARQPPEKLPASS